MRYNPNWASHLPMLIKTLNLSDGPVLEMGMGPFSTPVLHWLCLDRKRFLVSYENNPEYFESNKSFKAALHQIDFVEDWGKINIDKIKIIEKSASVGFSTTAVLGINTKELDDTHWGVAFIDHSPNERRMIDIEKLANCADYIVIHDSEESQEHKYHYEEIYPFFKYRYNYKRQKPYTTVLSNFKDLSILSK